MNKYKLIWYKGNVTEIKEKLAEKEVEADNFIKTHFLDILPTYEVEKHKTNIKYCCRIIYLEEGKIWTVDYGSYANFIWIEKL